MRIESSSIVMAGRHAEYKSYRKEESLTVRVGERMPAANGKGSAVFQQSAALPDQLELSEQAKAMLAQGKQTAEAGRAEQEVVLFEISEQDKQKILLLQRMIEQLTGKKIKFYVPKALKLKVSAAETGNLETSASPPGRNTQG